MGHYDDFCMDCRKHEDDCNCPPSPYWIEAQRRKKWDSRFLTLAGEVAKWSKDPSTQVGAVIFRPDLTIVSMGFNGFPRGTDDAPELYENRAIKYERVIHAELNAILSAREPLKGYSIATTLYPCSRCAGAIIQAGLARVVAWTRPDNENTRRIGEAACWSDSAEMLLQAGIRTEEIGTQEASRADQGHEAVARHPGREPGEAGHG